MIPTALLALALIGADAPTTIPVGVARVDITPGYPTTLSGYLSRKDKGPASGVGMRIHARALAIGSDELGPAVLIAVDSLGVSDAIVGRLAAKLAKRGVARDGLVVAASHTHSAPRLDGVAPHIFGRDLTPDERASSERYTKELEAKLEALALDALADRKPSRLAWGRGTVGFASNRRTNGGPVDHTLPILRAEGADGSTRAIVVNYACHCVTLDASDNLIHGDWAGLASQMLEREHPEAVALTLIGCGADANPSTMHGRDSEAKARAHARALADEANRLQKRPLTPLISAPICRMTRVALPLDTLPARADLDALVKKGGPPGYNAKTFLDRLDRREVLPDRVDYPINVWRFSDDLVMVFLAGEVVVDYSLRLRAEIDPTRLWITAYANDDPCYIPSERILREGGYEGSGAMVYYGWPTRFKPGVEALIDSAVLAMVPESFRTARPRVDAMPPVLSPEEASKAIRTKPGLRVELVATEPLIQSPVAIDWGPDGTLWVAEMRDYPTGMDGNYEPGGVIKALKDTDGDGRYDRAIEFLTGVPFPTGVMAYRKGVLVCAAPEILYAEDTDGDGRADIRKVVFRGFATENYQARVNGLSYSLDNWIYGANGLIGGRIEGSTGGPPIDIGGRDFRLSPDLTRLEPASGLTQQGRTHDDWGNQFGGNNSVLIAHYPMPDHYARRNPYIAAPNPSVYVPADPDSTRLYPVSVTGERFNHPESANRVTSACSLAIYRDDLLGPQYKGNTFICEPVHNLVHREVLTPKGATFSGHRADDEKNSEFLASTDPWFRPVQVRTGPDGGLYIVDMARFVIEHPRWISPERLATLDVRAGHDRGRIYRVVPDLQPARKPPRLDTLATDLLTAWLDAPNGTLRDLVQRLLIERADPEAVGLLEYQAVASLRPEVRAQALWCLDGLGKLSTPVIVKALEDVDAAVRRQAIRLAEPRLIAERHLALKGLALRNDADPGVRYQLALSLGALHTSEAHRALADLATTGPDDPWLIAAVLSSSYRGASEVLTAVLAHPESDRTRALVDPLVRVVAHEPPEAIRAAFDALSGRGSGLAPWRIDAMTTLLDGLDPARRAVVGIDPGRFTTIDAEALALADRPDAPTGDRAIAFRWLARAGGTEAGRAATLGAIAVRNPADVQVAAVAALAKSDAAGFADEMIARWPGALPPVRRAILDTFASRPASALSLLAAVEAGTIRPNDLDAAGRQRFLTHKYAAVRDRAAKVIGLDRGSSRAEVVDTHRDVRPDASDPPRGAAVFGKVCAACHRYRDRGTAVGPDLAALTDRSSDAFLTAILDPNREVDARYVVYSAALRDGRAISGVLGAETANGISLVREEGKVESILRSDLEELAASGKSLMPEGLEGELSKADLSHLLAFLGAESERPKSLPGNAPRPVIPNGDGSIRLDATTAAVYGPTLVFEAVHANLGYWSSPADRAAWSFRVDRTGTYTLSIEMACAEDSEGNAYEIRIDDASYRGVAGATGPGWDVYRGVFVAEAKLTAGAHRLEVRSVGPIRNALFDLRSVRLDPRPTK
jgi:putative membrane-bound dehydrogenase-like protein